MCANIAMRIIYTRHALERIAIRFIAKEWIEKALTNPDLLLNLSDDRKQAIKKINGDKISVVFIIEDNKFVIITVFWGE